MSVRARAISSLSVAQKRNTVMSVAEVGLNPVSGQRARAFSNLSTVENKLEAAVLDKSDDSEKNFKYYLKQACLPWDPVEFEEFGVAGKIFSVCFAPLYILCKWTIPIVAQKEEQSWNKPLMLIQSVLFPWSFYLLLKQYDPELADFGPLNRAVIPAILSVVFFAFVFLTTMRLPLNRPPNWYFLSTIVGFLGCIVWIYVIATELVGVLTCLGYFWNINNVVMGLSLLSWANSIGDFVADYSLAKAGRARTAIAACFGAPLLNLLVGVGFGCTVSISTTGKDIELDFGPTEICLVAGGTAILLALLVILPMTNYRTNKALGIFNMCVYVVFITLCLYFGFQL